jgi:hypothetical protein
MIGELPAYVLDKHTALGKAAIRRFARECSAVRKALAAHVPEYRAVEERLVSLPQRINLEQRRSFCAKGSAINCSVLLGHRLP